MLLDAILDTIRTGLCFAGRTSGPATDAELAELLLRQFSVRFPDLVVCPGHSTPWRAFCDAYFARHRVIVIKGSRLFAGKSFLLATLGVVEATTLGANVSVLGGSGAQSRRVLAHMQRLWNAPGAPRDLLRSDPGQYMTRLTTGNEIEALMASQRSARGGHPPRLRLDEVDELDLRVFDAAMGQTFGGDQIPAQTVISSTHHHPDGTMTEVLRRAARQGWKIHEYCYRETLQPHGWLDPAEVDAKRTEMTDGQWQVEVELQEPSGEGRAIVPEKARALFDERLGVYEGDEHEDIIVEPPAGGRYATGVDWARDVHWTVMVTWRIDVRPWRLVAFERLGRRPWPDMTSRLVERLRRYPGPAWHDRTGLGTVIEDLLRHQGAPMERIVGMDLVGRTREELFTRYISLIEQGELRAPVIRHMRQEHLFLRSGDLTGGGHPPDSFVAAALAAGAASARPRSASVAVIRATSSIGGHQ